LIVLRSGLGRILAGCEAVLFDKDGTLVDIHHYWASMIRLRASLLAEQCSVDVEEGVLADRLIWAMGVDQKSGRIRPEGPVGVQPRSVIVSVATEVIHEFGLTVTEAEVEQAFTEVDYRTAGDLASLVRILPGVEELLEVLSSHGVGAAVVTTDLSERARSALASAGILNRFEVVLGGDDVACTKPAPDLALAAVDSLGVDVRRTAVIGDHPVDVGMAMAAGCGAAVGVLTGLAGEADFLGKPCAMVPDLTHLSVTGGGSDV
tara:strand:+ start:1148 stop:1933 length:786 start_codon:yes stop_codon:yes gene_type:complete